MALKYEEQDLAGGWSVVVTRNGITVGHIRKHGAGDGYVYFEGSKNQLSWSLEDRDIDSLKRRIEQSHR